MPRLLLFRIFLTVIKMMMITTNRVNKIEDYSEAKRMSFIDRLSDQGVCQKI